MPVLMMPISVATMKMPPRVTRSMANTNATLPVSPPIVPGSSVRSRLRQNSSAKSRPSVSALSRSVPDTSTRIVTATMISSDRTKRPTMSATVPRDM